MVRSSQRLDAFDQWCLRHILRVPFTAHVTNQEVRLRSAQPPVTQTVLLRRLRFFGHIIRSDSDELLLLLMSDTTTMRQFPPSNSTVMH